MLLLNVLELYHGWRLIDYFEYCNYRFVSRPARWKGMDETPDETVAPSPATHAIFAQLKAGETVYQAGELPETFRVSKIVVVIKALNYAKPSPAPSAQPQPQRPALREKNVSFFASFFVKDTQGS